MTCGKLWGADLLNVFSVTAPSPSLPASESCGAELARWMNRRGDFSGTQGDAECFAAERTQALGITVCHVLRSVSAQHKAGTSCRVNMERYGTGSQRSSNL